MVIGLAVTVEVAVDLTVHGGSGNLAEQKDKAGAKADKGSTTSYGAFVHTGEITAVDNVESDSSGRSMVHIMLIRCAELSIWAYVQELSDSLACLS